MLVDYFAKDIGIVFCALLLGVHLGKYVFDYNGCLVISIVVTFLAFLFLLMFRTSEYKFRKHSSLVKSVKTIFNDKLTRSFLFTQLIAYIAYGIVFDLMMLILTEFIGFNASFSAIFIMICNMFGTIFSFIFSKFSKTYSVRLSAFIKYGTRAIVYLLAFFSGNSMIFIFTIIG